MNDATINPVVNAAISVWVAPKPAVAKKKIIPRRIHTFWMVFMFPWNSWEFLIAGSTIKSSIKRAGTIHPIMIIFGLCSAKEIKVETAQYISAKYIKTPLNIENIIFKFNTFLSIFVVTQII
jgi:hypothetical protein